jgi:hypothetical protein
MRRLFALFFMLLLVGCSEAESSPTSTDEQVATEVAVNESATPEDFNIEIGARAELFDAVCTRDEAGNWSFTGTLTNADPEQAYTYSVTAYVALVEGGTVVGQMEVTETVAAGDSVPVAAEAFYEDVADGLHCVFNVTKAPATD